MESSSFGLGSMLLMGQATEGSSAAAGNDCKSVRRFVAGF